MVLFLFSRTLKTSNFILKEFKMAFDIGNFNTPIYEENSEEPNRVVIISCEGCVTEPEYFRTIIEKCKNIIPLVEIEIV